MRVKHFQWVCALAAVCGAMLLFSVGASSNDIKLVYEGNAFNETVTAPGGPTPDPGLDRVSAYFVVPPASLRQPPGEATVNRFMITDGVNTYTHETPDVELLFWVHLGGPLFDEWAVGVSPPGGPFVGDQSISSGLVLFGGGASVIADSSSICVNLLPNGGCAGSIAKILDNPGVWTLLPVASGPTVWTNPTLEFSKSAFADSDQPENQDRITPLVWITRASIEGLYNAAQEQQFLRSMSPADTEWAFQALNGNPAAGISAADFDSLIFADWTTALEGSVAPNIVDRPSVVHLINEDIYIDIIVTEWGVGGGAGGSFTYLRASPTANEDNAGTVEGIPVTIDVLANDKNLSFPTTVLLPGGGVSAAGCTVVINGRNPGDPAQINVTYDAACGPGAPLPDVFDYTVDVAGQQSTAQVFVQVDANMTPLAPDATGADIDTTGVDPASQTSAIDVAAIAGSNPGNTPSIVTIVAQGTQGTAAAAGTVITYVPAGTSYVGTDSYTYQIEDEQGDTDTGLITVNYVDRQPVAGDGSAVTDEDAAVDVDLDSLTTPGNGPEGAHVNGIVSATGGTASFPDPLVNNVVTYTPDPGFVGQGSFTYFVEDADDDRAEGTVLVTVNAAGGMAANRSGGGSSALSPLSLILLLSPLSLRLRGRVLN